MLLFVFKNVFPRRNLFVISLFISLFMKGAWFARTYRLFQSLRNGASVIMFYQKDKDWYL